jgi:hypothetical protein
MKIFDDRRIVLALSAVALAKPTPIERPRLALVNADTDMGPVGAMQENIGSVGAIREREYFAAPRSPLNDFTCRLEPVLFDKVRLAQLRAVLHIGGGRRRGEPMSALGHKQTFCDPKAMSALPPKADMCGAIRDVCFGPRGDNPLNFAPFAILDYPQSSASMLRIVGRCCAISCQLSPSSRLANTEPLLVPK